MKPHILFCILLLAFAPLKANTVLKHISNTDGLSNNSVNCIFEDSDNVVWIGTWDGLNAYDGRDIRTYRYSRNNDRSISNNIIRQIVEQDKNHLWVATDHGINLWDKYTQEFTPFFHGADRKPKQENSYLIGVWGSKNICCYSKEEGWFYYDDALNKFLPLSVEISANITQFAIDLNDNIYILLHSGEVYTSHIKDVNGKPIIGKLQKLETDDPAPIEKIHISGNHLLLYSKAQILVHDVEHKTAEKIKIDSNKNASSLLLHKNCVYVSFYEGGCQKYNLTTKDVDGVIEISDKLPIFTLFFGSQDILWTGTDGQGVLMLSNYTAPFTKVVSEYPVRCFSETNKGEILVGSKGGGVKILNKADNSLSNYLDMRNGLLSNSVYALKKNSMGDIFIGTEGRGIGVKYADQKDVEYLLLPEGSPTFRSVYCMIFTNQDSTLWMGTSGHGLIKASIRREGEKYDVDKIEQFTSSVGHSMIGNDIIYAIAKGDTDDELWFGTRGAGLYKIDIHSNTITSISDEVLTNNDVLCIQNTQSGTWVGTSYGLNQLLTNGGNENIRNSEYTDNQGLANNTIHGILEDAYHNIWISSNLGLSFLNTTLGKVENYTALDGLQSNEFSDGAFFIDSNNDLYFGGVDGFNYFKPDNIKKRDFTPTLRLSQLKIYNTQQHVQQRIVDNMLRLAYDEQYISFSFVTNDFINNENCEFHYRLSESSEGAWIYNGNNSNIIFTKLSPGNYTLELKYTNGDKVPNDFVYSLNIRVDNPWWFSNIAIAIYLILVGIFAFITQSVIKNRIRQNRQILLDRVEKQHQQKMHEAKLDFFTNVAHEFFTPLTLIYGPAQHLLDTSDLDSYNKRYIRIIKNNAERMQKLISELMDFRKAKSGHKTIYAETVNIKTLVEYISDSFTEISEQNEIRYKVVVSSDFSISSDRDFLEKILMNLISNAIKYTPTKGYVHLNVWNDEESKHLRISIKNSGKGLTDSQMTELFNKYKIYDNPQLKGSVSTGIGLNLTKSLIELLGGTIKVQSVYGEYVVFEVIIPPLKQSLEINQTSTEQELINQDSDNIPLMNIIQEKNVCILIVDDEKNIRELLKDILSPYYQIVEAVDGREALEIVEHSHPNIIISDIMMPHIDGFSLIDRLKSNPKTVHIPIISISAKASMEDSIKAYKHGADLYIMKPFHPRHVLATVENLIRKQKELASYYQLGISSMTLKDGIELHKEDEQFIHNIASYIHENITDESLSPTTIADFIGLSKPTLYRNLKKTLDATPSELIRTIRLEHAAKLLLSTKYTVKEIMDKCGFGNRSYFYREFAKKYNASPVEYRNKHIPGCKPE